MTGSSRPFLLIGITKKGHSRICSYEGTLKREIGEEDLSQVLRPFVLSDVRG